MAKRLYSAVTTLLIVLVMLLAMLLAGVRLIGLVPYTVLSGSMEPNYHVGSLVYVRDTDPLTMQKDDPVTYRMEGGTVVTHRIVEVLEDEAGRKYRTKGDANNTPDGVLLTPDRIIGKPLFTIPLLGYVSFFVQNPPGSYATIAICALILVLILLTDFIFPARDKPSPPDADEASLHP